MVSCVAYLRNDVGWMVTFRECTATLVLTSEILSNKDKLNLIMTKKFVSDSIFSTVYKRFKLNLINL